jgi:predicted metal-dependent hydrolase
LLPTKDFESSASAIPPPGQYLFDDIDYDTIPLDYCQVEVNIFIAGQLRKKREQLMPNITLNNTNINYQIKYSIRRKTIQIKIEPTGIIIVTVPAGLPQKRIENLLKDKTSWITTQLGRITKLAKCPINSALTPGAKFLYLGEARILNVATTDAKRPRVTLDGPLLTVHICASDQNQYDSLLPTLRQWYIRAATEHLILRTAYWSKQIGVHPQHISIREQKTRWGSASPSGNINYNWRIIMAPPKIIDYLIVHELCHIKIPNHSADFWKLVAQSVPNYNECRSWLKLNGLLLTRILSRY